VVALDLTTTDKLSVRLILFEGRHDRNVNSEAAAAWFETVKAPDKHLVWFEHSAHIPMTEEPGKGPPAITTVWSECSRLASTTNG
jgi:proline iminopeptidase